MKNYKLSTVNYHLIEFCDMKCKFCFANFEDHKGKQRMYSGMRKDDAMKLIRELSKLFSKINFVGGEPMLHPWITDLIKEAKKYGMITSIVTNGYRLLKNPELLQTAFRGYLDMIGVSIDSLDRSTNLASGRNIFYKGQKVVIQKTEYIELCKSIVAYGYELKINTTVHRFNLHEDFNTFLEEVKPQRWKVFQVLKIEGENDEHIQDFQITAEEFGSFIERHQDQRPVAEDNDAMIDSYAMVSPSGRFFGNSNAKIKTTEKTIMELGVHQAYNQMQYSRQKFEKRDGDYQEGSKEYSI